MNNDECNKDAERIMQIFNRQARRSAYNEHVKKCNLPSCWVKDYVEVNQ